MKATHEVVGNAHLIYVKLTDEKVDHSVNELARVQTDRDMDGKVVGIEIILTLKEEV